MKNLLPKLLAVGLFLYIAIGCSALSFAASDVLVLDTGRVVTGEVITTTSTYVMINVQGGSLETFYWGEIATLNGHNVIQYAEGTVAPPIPAMAVPAAPVAAPQVQTKAPAKVPAAAPAKAALNKDEEDSLIRFMNKRPKPAPQAKATPAASKAPVTAPAADKPKFDSKNIVATPDGGFLVVGPQKITKYDQNLQVIKQVDVK